MQHMAYPPLSSTSQFALLQPRSCANWEWQLGDFDGLRKAPFDFNAPQTRAHTRETRRRPFARAGNTFRSFMAEMKLKGLSLSVGWHKGHRLLDEEMEIGPQRPHSSNSILQTCSWMCRSNATRWPLCNRTTAHEMKAKTCNEMLMATYNWVLSLCI